MIHIHYVIDWFHPIYYQKFDGSKYIGYGVLGAVNYCEWIVPGTEV